MNAIPGRRTLGRAASAIASAATQRAADLRVVADVDTAADLRDAATRFHAALTQAEFNTEPPVDLTLVTMATAGLAAVDLDAYQRRIGDRVAGVAPRLDPDHMDDTGALASIEVIDRSGGPVDVTQIGIRQLLDTYETRASNCSKAASEASSADTITFLHARSSLLDEIVRDLRWLSAALLGDRS